MKKIQEIDRITLINLYKQQIEKFGLQRWLKHSAKIVKAAHKRLNFN